MSAGSLATRMGRANPPSGRCLTKNPLFDSKSRILAKHASKNVRKKVKNVPKTARFGWISVEKSAEKFIDGTRPDMMGNAIEPRMGTDGHGYEELDQPSFIRVIRGQISFPRVRAAAARRCLPSFWAHVTPRAEPRLWAEKIPSPGSELRVKCPA